MTTEKIISIVSSELKAGKTGKQYLDITDQDGVRFSCWEESLWNFLGKNAGAIIEFEQKGIFKNISNAKSVEGELPPARKPIMPDTGNIPTEHPKPAPQEVGMWTKELGEAIRSGQLEKDFPKMFVKIKTAYYKKMSEVTRVPFWAQQEEKDS